MGGFYGVSYGTKSFTHKTPEGCYNKFKEYIERKVG
tara:strand:+ start:572 stop:679 length:108 start_codon:yes stop_codon:yes gene_type:complete